MVVMNAGDALTLRFDNASIPAVRPGMKRSFYLHTVGWEKDGDHNVVDGDTVDPLPESDAGTKKAAPDDWRIQYNTRWVPPSRFSDLRSESPAP
jgi:hypothetical protein